MMNAHFSPVYSVPDELMAASRWGISGRHCDGHAHEAGKQCPVDALAIVMCFT